MKKSGNADLALMGGTIPSWLFARMKQLALPMVEAIVLQNGKEDFLARLSNPFWFQSFASVIGMDWNSSGATTAVMSALKQTINPVSKELGLYVCGGKGKESLKTPQELVEVGNKTGLNGNDLSRASKLSAKVDNTAVQDGFNLYLHSFIISDEGHWSVIQQGMHTKTKRARRYHWHSENIQSFVEEPHTAICGLNEETIINLVDKRARPTQQSILDIAKEQPDKILKELPHLLVPSYCDVKAKDIDIKRLGSILWLAQEAQTTKFEDLLLLKGLGPRTLQSLTLVSEVINGTPSRFRDPARFSFAHGAKNAKPFPIPLEVYDETITTLKSAVEIAKINRTDKLRAIEKLSKLAQLAEANFEPSQNFDAIVKKENKDSHKYGGRSLHGFSKAINNQLNLFDSGE
ncbi:DUF763 domain-containing protein [Winogradskyella sp.]|uniref:DUF763 domain-containing protein n=1 Tax=Winogradskyella sp. TaxID=1883156 RepID=UPI003BAB22EA